MKKNPSKCRPSCWLNCTIPSSAVLYPNEEYDYLHFLDVLVEKTNCVRVRKGYGQPGKPGKLINSGQSWGKPEIFRNFSPKIFREKLGIPIFHLFVGISAVALCPKNPHPSDMALKKLANQDKLLLSG